MRSGHERHQRLHFPKSHSLRSWVSASRSALRVPKGVSDSGHGLDPSCLVSREAAGSPVPRALWVRSAHGASRVFMILLSCRWRSGPLPGSRGSSPGGGQCRAAQVTFGQRVILSSWTSALLRAFPLASGCVSPAARPDHHDEPRVSVASPARAACRPSDRPALEPASAEPWPLPLGDAGSVCSRFHVSRLLRFGDMFGRLTPRCPEWSWLGCVDRGTRSWEPTSSLALPRSVCRLARPPVSFLVNIGFHLPPSPPQTCVTCVCLHRASDEHV